MGTPKVLKYRGLKEKEGYFYDTGRKKDEKKGYGLKEPGLGREIIYVLKLNLNCFLW